MELRIPIYLLWIVALVSLAGTMLCAATVLVARAPTVGTGRAE
jgi:hypothetical protein